MQQSAEDLPTIRCPIFNNYQPPPAKKETLDQFYLKSEIILLELLSWKDDVVAVVAVVDFSFTPLLRIAPLIFFENCLTPFVCVVFLKEKLNSLIRF